MTKNLSLEQADKKAGTDQSKQKKRIDTEKLKHGEQWIRCDRCNRVNPCVLINKCMMCRRCISEYKEVLAKRKWRRKHGNSEDQ